MSSPTAKDWKRVGDAVKARRGSRTQQEVAAAAGIGTTALGEIERGVRSNFTQRTRSKLCSALRWSSDSIDRLLAGQEPIETPEEIPDGISYRTVPADDNLVILERVHSLVGELIRRAREDHQ